MQSEDKSANRRDSLIAVIVIVVLLLILLSLLLFGPQPEPLRVVNCPQPARDVPQSTSGHFVERQVVVIGRAQAITDVLRTVSDTIDLELAADCDLGYLGQSPEASRQNAQIGLFQPDDFDTLSVRLYNIKSTTTVTDAVREITDEGGGKVYADPNYLTISMVDAEACGNPNSTGGSPNSTGGSPNSTGGSPLEGIGPEAAAEMFRTQWAFRHISADTILTSSIRAAGVEYHGNSIRVGVFDTSPFPQSEGVLSATRVITWMSPPMILTTHTVTLPEIQRPTPVLSDVRDHGLFVAGLIHGIAPNSDIHLYPVLDNYGCGDLYTLVTALHQFISEVEVQRSALDGAVINLSLGVLQPKAIDAVTRTVEITELQEDDVESLLLTMLAAYQRGIVVVAAAGNDSWRDELRNKPLSPQLPAAYPFVIGAAGSNANRQRSCFSNWGDVSAPAGEGGPGQVPVISGTETITVATTCAAKLRECSDGSCEYGLIGPILLTNTLVYTSGYAYWSGTSFATPLVSGLAALTLDAGGGSASWLHPREVARAIKCGAATGDGVINVPTTLMRCIGP